MSKFGSSESRQAETGAKLVKLRNATMAVEKLLFGELVNSPCRAAIKPDWDEVTQPLLKLTEEYDFDCVELARILTTSAKLWSDSLVKPVRQAANFLIGLKNNKPAELQDPAGRIEIQKAAEAGDTKFFIQLGERLRKPAKHSKREIFSETRSLLWLWWQPNPRLNWPGLAYCKHPAQSDFFSIMMPRFHCSKNYLDNERRRMKLILSSQCFVSGVNETKGKLHFV
jgi:hypothetical protein